MGVSQKVLKKLLAMRDKEIQTLREGMDTLEGKIIVKDEEFDTLKKDTNLVVSGIKERVTEQKAEINNQNERIKKMESDYKQLELIINLLSLRDAEEKTKK